MASAASFLIQCFGNVSPMLPTVNPAVVEQKSCCLQSGGAALQPCSSLQRAAFRGASSPCSTVKIFLSFYFSYLRSPWLFSSVVLGYARFGAVIVASSGQGSVLEHRLLTFRIYCLQIHLASSQYRTMQFQPPSTHTVLPYPNG